MHNYDEIVAKLTNDYDICFMRSPQKELEQLRQMGFTEELIKFYEYYQPSGGEVNGITLFMFENIIDSNEDYMPGCYCSKFGYFVFANNEFGDAYCYDINNTDNSGNPNIVFVSHESVYDDITKEDMEQLAIKVADNILDFLEKLSVDLIPKY